MSNTRQPDSDLTPTRPTRWSEICIRIDLDSHVFGSNDAVKPKHAKRVQSSPVIPSLRHVLQTAKDSVAKALGR